MKNHTIFGTMVWTNMAILASILHAWHHKAGICHSHKLAATLSTHKASSVGFQEWWDTLAGCQVLQPPPRTRCRCRCRCHYRCRRQPASKAPSAEPDHQAQNRHFPCMAASHSTQCCNQFSGHPSVNALLPFLHPSSCHARAHAPTHPPTITHLRRRVHGASCRAWRLSATWPMGLTLVP